MRRMQNVGEHGCQQLLRVRETFIGIMMTGDGELGIWVCFNCKLMHKLTSIDNVFTAKLT